MKKTTILAAALFGGVLSSQAQVTTDPVGFVSVNNPANSDTPVGLPLARASVLQTTVVSVAGNVVTVSAGLTASQFVYAAGTQTNHYYLSVKSTVAPASSTKGKWFEITANTGAASNATITADGGASTIQAQGLAAGDTVEVIPFWTLNTLLPAGGGITPTADIDSPQDLVLQLPQNVSGTNLGAAKSSIYSTDVANLGVAGWYDSNSFEASGDDALVPDSYLVVRNKGAAQTVTVTGSVPMSNKVTSIVRLAANTKQDNFVVNPFPVPISLPGSNLAESGAFEATTDIDAPKDVLLVYTGTETGFNAQPSKSYIYSTDTVNLGAAGWYDASTFDGPYGVNDKVIPAGSGMIVRKASGAIVDLAWSAPKPY